MFVHLCQRVYHVEVLVTDCSMREREWETLNACELDSLSARCSLPGQRFFVSLMAAALSIPIGQTCPTLFARKIWSFSLEFGLGYHVMCFKNPLSGR